jgi:hypothetical protein
MVSSALLPTPKVIYYKMKLKLKMEMFCVMCHDVSFPGLRVSRHSCTLLSVIQYRWHPHRIY